MSNEYFTYDCFMELMHDFNVDFLLDLYEDIKEQYFYLGIMQNSKSVHFIDCIMKSVVLTNLDSHKPISYSDDTVNIIE